jgi:hypothetical protein
MFSSNSSVVYWLFRIYAGCALLAGLLHAVAWLADIKGLHSVATHVLLGGFLIGCLPLFAGVILAMVRRVTWHRTN